MTKTPAAAAAPVAKSKAQAKQMAQARKRDYSYTELSKLKISSDPVNIYGIIVDATFPHKSFKSDKYICTYKIADPSLKMKDGVIESISCVFFARRFEDLPISQTVGEIIRIHRATVGTYKDRLQLTVNICFNSSWALFSPQSKNKADFMPLSFFGRSMKSESNDKKIVQSLRVWTQNIFQKHPVLSNKYITSLDQAKAAGEPKGDGKPGFDFDMQVKIIQLFRTDDY